MWTGTRRAPSIYAASPSPTCSSPPAGISASTRSEPWFSRRRPRGSTPAEREASRWSLRSTASGRRRAGIVPISWSRTSASFSSASSGRERLRSASRGVRAALRRGPHCRRRRRFRESAARLVVVRAEARAISLVLEHRVLELRGVLDLVLRAANHDLLRIVVDALDHAGRQLHLLAEDPRPGVDDEAGCSDLVRRVVDLANRAVGRLDAVPDDVPGREGGVEDVLAKGPHVNARVHGFLLRSLAGFPFPVPRQATPKPLASHP